MHPIFALYKAKNAPCMSLIIQFMDFMGFLYNPNHEFMETLSHRTHDFKKKYNCIFQTSKENIVFGAHRNPRVLMCWLPKLERLFLANSSKLLDPSSLTTTVKIKPSATSSTYCARRRLSSLLRYVSNLRKKNNISDGNFTKSDCFLQCFVQEKPHLKSHR